MPCPELFDPSPIRIVLCDDHAVVRDGMVALLSLEPGFQMVGQAQTVAQSIELLAHIDADVALVDLSFPDGSGIEILRFLQRAKRLVRPLMLSSFAEDLHVFSALQENAMGYLLKSADKNTLFAAIRFVAAGGRWQSVDTIPKPVASKMPDPISSQEARVLRLMAEGESNEGIARHLGVSTLTIKTHVHHLLQKMHAHNRSEAVAIARRWLLI